MGRIKRIIAATAVVVGAGSVISNPASGLEPPAGAVDVEIAVRGPDASGVLGGLSFELFEEIGGTDVASSSCSTLKLGTTTPLSAVADLDCEGLEFGDYTVGLSGVPDGWTTSATCGPLVPTERIVGGIPAFTVSPQEFRYRCFVEVYRPVLAIDKVIEGGPAAVSDFEFEVYDGEGALVDTAGPIVDPSADLCTEALNECVLVALAPAEYILGEILPDYGYEVGSVECDSFIDLERYFGGAEEQRQEIIDDAGADFRTDDGDAYCTVTNVYREGQLIVTASVNNDDGGVAGVDDVSIEVYEADGDTPVVPATACAADGSCLDTMLPIGDYVIGYIGPDGYTREITQTVSQLVAEKVTDDADAAFTAAFGEVVEIEVAIDDPEPEPTTTTTQPATTTTAFDAGAGTLPPTGASSQTNTTIAVLAFASIAAGLALVGVRRRTA